MVAGALCALLASCGGGASQAATEPSGSYPVQITTARFPTRQRLAQATSLRLTVRNTGQQTIPALVITISADRNAILPFSIRDPQPGLANPDRPIWILENNFPRIAGQSTPAGAVTANSKTFAFGALPTGRSRAAIWRVTPVRPGTYRLSYRVDAGLQGKAKAVTADGSPPVGSFVVEISSQPPQTRVNGAGQVVAIPGSSR